MITRADLINVLFVIVTHSLLALGAGCVSREKERAAPRAAASPTLAATNAMPSADCTSRRVTGDGVGPIRMNASLAAIRRACPMVRDTTAPPNDNFSSVRLVSVSLGAGTAVVSLRRGRVVGVLLVGGRFTTDDSIDDTEHPPSPNVAKRAIRPREVEEL